MYTAAERKNIKKLLSRVADPDEAFNLEELHGFLFGLAILPEMIKPSEWLPIAFGEEMLEFEKQDDVNLLMGHLFSLYNRLNAENQKGTLVFAFDIGSLNGGDLQRMGDWAHGLSEAMALMPERAILRHVNSRPGAGAYLGWAAAPANGGPPRIAAW